MKALLWIGKTILVILAAPWAVWWACVSLVRRAVYARRALKAALSPTRSCPVGHPNDLLGRWTCSCSATFLGHAFDACPVCHLPAGWFPCRVCGLAVKASDA